ncbi:MAG: serine/threonine-protein kinase [Planctomycetota bacterium]|nr:serine/threonine-protein kinase [Planctomycetota bacterium]
MPGTKREPTPYKQGSWADAVDMPQTSFNIPPQTHTNHPSQTHTNHPSQTHANHPSQTRANMPTGFAFPSQSAAIQPVHDQSQSHGSSYEDSLPEIPGYHIERKLAEGGMGAVYIVRQEGTGAVRAAKTIKAKAVDVEALERFRIEYESLGLINHPTVVRVHASGVHNKVPYLVMELVEGEELGDELTEAWDPYYAAEISERICRALEAIHETGIIHRDIKPQNIFICADDQPKIADFGLARVMQGEGLTKTGDILGTPAYMAPEQVVAVQSEITHQVDIWAAGVMLYQMIAGVLPYEQRNAVGIMSEIALGSYPRIEDRVPDVDRNLAAIISKAMARSQEMRYQTAADMADDLLMFIDGDTPEARQQRDHERYLKWTKRLLAFFVVFSAVLFGLIFQQVQVNHKRRGKESAGLLSEKVRKQFEGWRGRFQSEASSDLDKFSKDLAKFKVQLKAELTSFDSEYSDVIEATESRRDLAQYAKDLGFVSKTLKGQSFKLTKELSQRPLLLSLLGDIHYFSAKASFEDGRIEAASKGYDQAWRCYIGCFGHESLTQAQNEEILKRTLYSFIKARESGFSFNASEGLAFFNMGDLAANSSSATFRDKLSALKSVIEEDPSLKKNSKKVKAAVSEALYSSFDHAFFIASKEGSRLDDGKKLGLHLDLALKVFQKWDTPVTRSYVQLEARAAPLFIKIQALVARIDTARASLQSKKQEALSSYKRRDPSKRRDVDEFFFWAASDLKHLVEDTRALLDQVEQARLLSYSRKNKRKLLKLTEPYFGRESYIFLRWQSRSDYRRALKLGQTLHKTIIDDSELLEWRLAEDLLMNSNPGEDSLEEARERLKRSLRQLDRFVKKRSSKTAEELKAILESETKNEHPQYTFGKRKRFLPLRLYGYLIRVEMLLGNEGAAKQLLSELEGRVSGKTNFESIPSIDSKMADVQFSERIRIVPTIESVRPILSSMSLRDVDKAIRRFRKLAIEERRKSFAHSNVFLISLYLRKAKLTRDPTQRKALAAAIDFLKLERSLREYQSNPYPYEFYVEWIQGLMDLAGLYQSLNRENDARRILTLAKTVSAHREHSLIRGFNQDISNRLRKLAR